MSRRDQIHSNLIYITKLGYDSLLDHVVNTLHYLRQVLLPQTTELASQIVENTALILVPLLGLRDKAL